MDIRAKFDEAEKLFLSEQNDDAAAEIYLELEKYPECRAVCLYRLAQIANKMHDATTAYNLYYAALDCNPRFFADVMSANSDFPNKNYVFKGKKEEKENIYCPFCKKEGEPYWCYPLPEAGGYNNFFNPIRLWLKCPDCNHLFSKYFPEKLFLFNDKPRRPNPAFFSYYSEVLANIRNYTNGMKILEVGIGASECALAAREIGYDVLGLDVIEKHVEYAKQTFGLRAVTCDFVEFESDEKFDIVMMGDVLEHVSDTIIAIKKANEVLNNGGVIWISTPNYESAFSAVVGHDDPMRKQTFHLNYFSRQSLYSLLLNNGFVPVDYRISKHYNGSMEVVAIKQS